MIKTWPGQTFGEYVKEVQRNDSLTREEREKEYNEYIAEQNKKEEEEQKLKQKIKEENDKNFYGDCDHPNSLENGEATVIYIIVMLVGAIFVDRWLIWILASIIYFSFITRHHRKK